jgi:hypothetical protein
LKKRLARFQRDESASFTVEAVVFFPVIMMTIMAMFTFYDMFKTRSISLKANYAISDYLSRESTAISESYLKGLFDVYQYLSPAADAPWMRVTVVGCTFRCDADTRELFTHWSYSTQEADALDNDYLSDAYMETIPAIASGEYVVMVETGYSYNSPIKIPFAEFVTRHFNDVVVTRPRFVPKLDWAG